jgi:hypothetical protein
MQPGQPQLSIDYGTTCTRAVLGWPDGRWEPLPVDGAGVLWSAVHLDDRGGVLVGEAAWRQAATDPDGFVPSPLAGLTGPDGGTVPVRGAPVPVAELAAATLRHVAGVAVARLGGPPGEVRMVVPAGWGPRRRMWLRQVAHAAGLGQPRLVDAPVAAATRLLAMGVQVPVGGFLLICDLGAGCEATVLRRGPTGFEVLSTLADPHAGAAAIDDRLITALTGTDPAADPDGTRWTVAATVRAAREALSRQAVTTVPMPPPTPPMVVHARLVDELAEPVLKQAATLAAQAVTAADLTIDQLTGSYLIGATASMPAAPRVIGAQLGTAPQVVPEPGFAAVLGAADAGPAPMAGGTAVPDAAGDTAAGRALRLRRLWGLLLPGVASLALYWHMLSSATFHNGTPDTPRAGYYVLATWGELTLAAVFALLACMAAAPLLGAALARAQQRDYARPAVAEVSVERTAGGIALAVTAGVAIAAIYGVAAAVYCGLPVSQPLRWALLPLLPPAAVAAGIAWLARRPIEPARGWEALLAFPNSSTLLTAAGMLLLATWWTGPIPAVLSGWGQTLGRVGGMLIGVGIACTLVSHLGLRVALAVFVAFFGFLVVGAGGTGILAVGYALAVTAWWASRLWILQRQPTTADVH